MMRLSAISPDVFRLHGEGRYAEALSVVEGAIDQLPEDDRPTATFWRICLLSRTGQIQAAIVELDSALSRGWWFGEELLRTDDDLSSLQGDSAWEPLVTESLQREAAASQTPAVGEHHLTDHLPVTGSVVALHGGGGRVRDTADTWMQVTTLGYDLHVPGSSQRLSHDRASWNDRDLAYHEIVEQVRPELRTDRVIAVGRSQGASRAAELASRGDMPIVGLVLVALAPLVEHAPEVQVPAYVIAGGQDQPQFLERIDAFVGLQSSRGVPVHLERLDDMSHEYPEPFTPHLEKALHWLRART
jgi:pimeloyl-ACP methyl ester carboxylesterase